MKTCPDCGKILSNRLSFGAFRSGYGRTVSLIWECPVCGDVAVTDRSGLHYYDIADRYKFTKNEVRK